MQREIVFILGNRHISSVELLVWAWINPVKSWTKFESYLPYHYILCKRAAVALYLECSNGWGWCAFLTVVFHLQLSATPVCVYPCPFHTDRLLLLSIQCQAHCCSLFSGPGGSAPLPFQLLTHPFGSQILPCVCG